MLTFWQKHITLENQVIKATDEKDKYSSVIYSANQSSSDCQNKQPPCCNLWKVICVKDDLLPDNESSFKYILIKAI